MDIYKKIEHFITQHALIQHNDTIIIGLSGGPDSVFLLHTLAALAPAYNLTLIAAHLNHEWRPEADAEEELCHTIAKKLGIKSVSARLSSLTKCTVKYNGSKEEYARKMRRFFLEKIADEYGAQRIALGHHAQDQQETFFIRLMRGTSLAGLTAMHPQHNRYIRPLLTINKNTILDMLNKNSIAYADDASNNDSAYLRNRIRHTVLPALSHCDARFNANFATTLKRLADDNALLDTVAHNSFTSLITTVNGTRMLDITQFSAVNKALHHRIIIHWLITEKIPFPTTQAFLDEIIRFLCSPRGGTHAIHERWSLVKKQKKAFILFL